MISSQTWSNNKLNIIGSRKKILAKISLYIRKKQYSLFNKYLRPNNLKSIIDIGVTPDEILVDSNFFEYIYPYKNNLIIASVEDCEQLVKKFNVKKFVKLKAGTKYPFKKNEFDILTSWATLEHVGGLNEQKLFLSELNRIGKSFFITTPYRFFFYELHTGLLFIHWLPPRVFRKILKMLGMTFWANERYLNLLSITDLNKILPQDKLIKVEIFYSFGFLPTHILIYKN